jgi:GTPase-activator protein for Ras-like GTPase
VRKKKKNGTISKRLAWPRFEKKKKSAMDQRLAFKQVEGILAYGNRAQHAVLSLMSDERDQCTLLDVVYTRVGRRSALKLVKRCVASEIAKTRRLEVLMRTDSQSVRVLSRFVWLEGQRWLERVLLPVLMSLVSDDDRRQQPRKKAVFKKNNSKLNLKGKKKTATMKKQNAGAGMMMMSGSATVQVPRRRKSNHASRISDNDDGDGDNGGSDVDDFEASGVHLERCDSSEHADDDDSLSQGAETLTWAHTILDRMSFSLERMPELLKVLSAELVRLAVSQFGVSAEQAAKVVFNGVFFLRLACPAIVEPQRFAIFKDVAMPPVRRRHLVRVAKRLQALANDGADERLTRFYALLGGSCGGGALLDSATALGGAASSSSSSSSQQQRPAVRKKKSRRQHVSDANRRVLLDFFAAQVVGVRTNLTALRSKRLTRYVNEFERLSALEYKVGIGAPIGVANRRRAAGSKSSPQAVRQAQKHRANSMLAPATDVVRRRRRPGDDLGSDGDDNDGDGTGNGSPKSSFDLFDHLLATRRKALGNNKKSASEASVAVNVKRQSRRTTRSRRALAADPSPSTPDSARRPETSSSSATCSAKMAMTSSVEALVAESARPTQSESKLRDVLLTSPSLPLSDGGIAPRARRRRRRTPSMRLFSLGGARTRPSSSSFSSIDEDDFDDDDEEEYTQ